jgi:hypothetical protein
MSITIEDLRRQWREAISDYDRTIAHLEEGNLIHPLGEDAVRATEIWLGHLRNWREELENLLVQFRERK